MVFEGEYLNRDSLILLCTIFTIVSDIITKCEDYYYQDVLVVHTLLEHNIRTYTLQ